ncbi:MAG: efflux RND transporter permease subunit [Planctomycetota bacterium]|nr:efflux RND transporter permease subunit [Planctomycetota bacterium]
MHPIQSFITHPVKVSVGVLLVSLFGGLSILRMPMQLTPEVERPTISIRTNWPGRSPQEVEKEIVQKQEEQLQSVEGVVKLSSESSNSRGQVRLEFNVGTDMQEAILKVNSRLQQVGDYPVDADEPIISTSNSADSPVAWVILSARPASREKISGFQQKYPEHREGLEQVLTAQSPGLAMLRIRQLAKLHPELEPLLPADIDIPTLRKFAKDQIASRFERVDGVSAVDLYGGREPELQVIVDPQKLAARGLTLTDVRDRLRSQNVDTSGGDLWELKRRYVVRTLGQYNSPTDVEQVVLAIPNGQPVLVKDVATVRLDYRKPEGYVRRFGTNNLSVGIRREGGANVLEVMEGVRRVTAQLNEGVLKNENLTLTQVYDETVYIQSSMKLVNQNIILGSALTVIILVLFLHLDARTILLVPLLSGSALVALLVSPWFFLVTLLLIFIAGFWYARGALVVSLAIPISIVGTFLILNSLGRSLNVISLAGLAFAVGMLVDNAVVVLENIYRYYQRGYRPAEAALKGTKEVWGAVLASTLTTLFVFVPVLFLQGEVGQLFADIALAISSAVALSLLVSVIVIPMASAKILGQSHSEEPTPVQTTSLTLKGSALASSVASGVLAINRFAQISPLRQLGIVTVLTLIATVGSYFLFPAVEYLPTGNRNMVRCAISPPPGYNLDKMLDMGAFIEEELQPYWDVQPGQTEHDGAPTIKDFFYVAYGNGMFMGLQASDPLQARSLVELIRSRLSNKFPGSFVFVSQSSLFERRGSGGRTIEIEVSGPELRTLIDLGRRIMGDMKAAASEEADSPVAQVGKSSPLLPESTQMRPEPSLDLNTPELHVVAKPIPASEVGISNEELGYAINTIVDGAYVTDYFLGGDKIDLVLWGSEELLSNSMVEKSGYTGQTQDLESKYIATRNSEFPVRLSSIANIDLGAGPQQINHRERQRSISITVTPPPELPLETAINVIQTEVLSPLSKDPRYSNDYTFNLSGTANKLRDTWLELRWNILIALLVTYLLMAALFESWVYPLVIIFSVPLGAVGGLLGLQLLSVYLSWQGAPPQPLDVLTMLGFVILIGTVVNNAILIVHQTLNLIRDDHLEPHDAVLESVRTRVRPICMTTATTVCGLAPLVFFPGAGSELYRGIGAVVLGGLVVSTVFTLVLVPNLFTLVMRLRQRFGNIAKPIIQSTSTVDSGQDSKKIDGQI